eukprot:GEZU01026997.1.p1 GENE.GEZU01026997.1~~GEZU01026997.1.p1  ORF type:complete len:520 (+),score=79.12 GEZU01026997.1:508-2067(+)
MTGIVDEILAVDKELCSGWRSKEYLEHRKNILQKKQANGKLGKRSDRDSLLVYQQWRRILVQHKKSTFLSIGSDLRPFAKQLEGALDPPTNSTYDNMTDLDEVTFTNTYDDSATRRSSISSETNEDDNNEIRSTKPPLADTYAFVGMHHIFDCATGAITTIKFANNDPDRIAFSTVSGELFLTNALEDPKVQLNLVGHTKAITDFDWSLSNEYILSVSLDRTIRVWDTSNAKCLRIIYQDEPGTCVRFLPRTNNNIFIVGSATDSSVDASATITSCLTANSGHLKVFNLSTGKECQTIKFKEAITCLTFTETGDILFAGTSKGDIYVYFYVENDEFKPVVKTTVAKKIPLTSISYSSWYSSGKEYGSNPPSLIVNSMQDGVTHLKVDNFDYSKFATLMASSNARHGYYSSALKSLLSKIRLTPVTTFPIVQRTEPLRSIFCPLISFRSGACFVSGSEDGTVYIYDILKKQKQKQVVNKLMGHAAPVISVSFNYDESLLASGDKEGIVILWKRQQLNQRQ